MSKNVTLADFVAETLASISDGVRRAQDHSQQNGGVPIAPSAVDGEIRSEGDQLVHFSVTVEAEVASSKTGSGQLGGPVIALAAGKASLEAKKDKKNHSQHTVEFSVPMHFNLSWNKNPATSGGDDANP